MKGKNSISGAKREPRELCYYFAAEVANAGLFFGSGGAIRHCPPPRGSRLRGLFVNDHVVAKVRIGDRFCPDSFFVSYSSLQMYFAWFVNSPYKVDHVLSV